MNTSPNPAVFVARHPIAVVADRTGLSQDVLRIWERRYRAVEPRRGEGGQRLYTDADIERLSLLQEATRAGRSIGRIAELPTDAVRAMVDEDSLARERRPLSTEGAPNASEDVRAALALAQSLDATALDEALRRSAAMIGISSFLESVAAPLLRRVGDEWHAGRVTPAQEHMVTSVLHDIILGTMRAFGPRDGAPAVLVATAAGERHVIGAALAGAAAAVEGWDVLYLGADLPAAEIAGAAAAARVRVVAVSIVYVDNGERVLAELRTLRSRLPAGVTLIAGGAGAIALEVELSALGVRVASSVNGLLKELRRARRER